MCGSHCILIRMCLGEKDVFQTIGTVLSWTQCYVIPRVIFDFVSWDGNIVVMFLKLNFLERHLKSRVPLKVLPLRMKGKREKWGNEGNKSKS